MVTGNIVCGDGQAWGTVREEDFFFGIMKVISPLELVLDYTQVQIDADSEEVDDDMRELIKNQINSSRAILKVESHLPLEAKAKIFFSRKCENLFSNPDLVIGPIDIPKGELDLGGSVRRSNSSQAEINLSHEELEIFTQVPFYMAGSIYFPGTNGNTTKTLLTDFIKVICYLELDVNTKKE
jgi:hypothetical protein